MKLELDELVKQDVIFLGNEGLKDDDLDVLITVIGQSTVLEKLYLYSNKLTLADGKLAAAIAKNKTLKVLDLRENNIGPDEVKYLAAALKTNNTLQSLQLDSSSIGDEGARCIAEMLNVNKTLKEISLDRNNIGDEGAEYIAASLTVNMGIQDIWLKNNRIGDKGAEMLTYALEANLNIKRLFFGGNNISEHVMDRIKALLQDPKRRIENDEDNNAKEDKDVDKNGPIIETRKKLDLNELVKEKVHLDKKGLQDDDLDTLCKVIVKSTCLHELSLRGNELTLSNGKLADAIAKNTTLKKLYLHHNNIGPEGIKLLTDALKKNNTALEALYLYGNNIGDKGAQYIADMLAVNNTIQVICLGNINISTKGAKHLADVLKGNNTLQKLYLTGNNIGADGAKYVADMIAVNKSLQEIGLSNNNIRFEGTKLLVDALKEKDTFRSFNLTNNNIGDEGAGCIADMLDVHKTLKVIDLSKNNITDKGAERIATSLTKNTGIHTMWLKNNSIGDKGAEKLADALESNHNIKDLRLYHNINSKHTIDRIKAIFKKKKEEKRKIENKVNNTTKKNNMLGKNQSEPPNKRLRTEDNTSISKDEEIALLRAKLKALEESEPASTKPHSTKRKIKSLQLGYEHTHCSITCHSKFSTDTDSKDENIRKHLPVLSSSKTCDHYFCHGCILRRQAAIAEENNGRVPKWIPCMVCNTKTAFCPSEPKYHRLLIDIIKQANWTDAPMIKEEPTD